MQAPSVLGSICILLAMTASTSSASVCHQDSISPSTQAIFQSATATSCQQASQYEFKFPPHAQLTSSQVKHFCANNSCRELLKELSSHAKEFHCNVNLQGESIAMTKFLTQLLRDCRQSSTKSAGNGEEKTDEQAPPTLQPPTESDTLDDDDEEPATTKPKTKKGKKDAKTPSHTIKPEATTPSKSKKSTKGSMHGETKKKDNQASGGPSSKKNKTSTIDDDDDDLNSNDNTTQGDELGDVPADEQEAPPEPKIKGKSKSSAMSLMSMNGIVQFGVVALTIVSIAMGYE